MSIFLMQPHHLQRVSYSCILINKDQDYLWKGLRTSKGKIFLS